MTKQITEKRPLFVFCTSFFAAGILTAGVSRNIKLILLCLGVLLVMSALIAEKAVKLRRLALYTAVLIVLPAGASVVFQLLTSDAALENCRRFDGVTETVSITIEDVRYSSSYYGYYTACISGGADVPDMTVSLGFPDGSCEVGDILKGDVTFRLLDNSSSFDESTYFIPDGILMCAEAEYLSYEGHDSSVSVTGFFEKLNRRLTSRICAASGGGELASAVLLGRRDLLEASVKRDFGRIGISHLLAVSGIHLSVAVAALELLLDKLRIRGRKKTLLLCSAVLFCMSLVGFSRSVVRAGVMHLIRYSGNLFGRRSDGLTSLGFAAVLIILFDPFSVYDTGFILSVLATYACITYSRYTKARLPAGSKVKSIIRGILDTVKLTLLITGLSLPVMWKVFGSISLISPLTNIVFIPAVSFFMYLSLIYTFLCGIPAVNSLLAPVLLRAEELICGCAQKLSVFPHITVSLKGFAVGLACTLVFLSLLIATFIYKKHRIISAVSVGICTVSLALCIIFGQLSAVNSAEADFVTRGKSEGFSIRCGNSYVLVDVSDGSSGFSRELMFSAEDKGATEISALILTHLHRRHISSVASLADSMILRQVFIPKAETESDIEVSEALCALFDRRGIPYTVYSRDGDSVSIGGVTYTPLGYTELSRSTHPVVGFSFTLAEREIVYLGSSFGERGVPTDEIRTADTVFLGAHPPVRKKEVLIETDGKAVLSCLADEKGLLTVTAQDGTVTLGEDAVYSLGRSAK